MTRASGRLEYKGYVGVAEFVPGDVTFHGRVVGLRDVITFESGTAEGLVEEFRKSVDDYLAFCRERGEEPEKPFSGQFVARVGPEVHRQASAAAAAAGKSLNAWAGEKLAAAAKLELSAAAKSMKPRARRGGVPDKKAKKARKGLEEGKEMKRTKGRVGR